MNGNGKQNDTTALGLYEKAKFDSDSTKPAETKQQRPKKTPIPTGGKQGFWLTQAFCQIAI